MFICESCHSKSGCEYEHLSVSIGRCETCGKTADCHGCLTYKNTARIVVALSEVLDASNENKP